MKKLLATALALALTSGAALAETYTVTVTNTLSEELFAPIVVTGAENDKFIFANGYVTPEAEAQILTGDPAKLVEAIGMNMAGVGHGMDGPPGVLLAPGDSVTFEVETGATTLRILAMVAPTMVPDNYVTAVADVSVGHEVTVSLDRYDIGNDEGTKKITAVSESVGTVTISRGM